MHILRHNIAQCIALSLYLTMFFKAKEKDASVPVANGWELICGSQIFCIKCSFSSQFTVGLSLVQLTLSFPEQVVSLGFTFSTVKKNHCNWSHFILGFYVLSMYLHLKNADVTM